MIATAPGAQAQGPQLAVLGGRRSQAEQEIVAIALQPIREYFDSERRPGLKLSVSDLPQTMRLVVTNYPLRDIAFSAFAFGGLQSVFSGFFILFLLDGLNYSETSAGTAFAIASFSAIWARIAWGVLGTSLLSARTVMA